jgi:UDP-N-acetylmuramyl tripeptide synthase
MKLAGIFNVSNALGAIACAKHFGIDMSLIKKGLESIEKVRGRVEKIDMGQPFEVVVDYAHTPESLKAIYEVYAPTLRSEQAHKLICVLGNTGGGRDKWKRPEMGKIADEYCSEIILTNEDPYDEDPMKILEEMKVRIKEKPCEIILDRREAIRTALSKAEEGSVVIITGKGTDPYIMEANGKKTPWDDASVVREELHRIMNQES